MAPPAECRVADPHEGQLGTLVALAAVFALYTRPAFLVTLVDQIWACF